MAVCGAIENEGEVEMTLSSREKILVVLALRGVNSSHNREEMVALMHKIEESIKKDSDLQHWGLK